MKKSTVIRTIALIVVLINMILKKFDIAVLPITESQIGATIEMLVEVAIIGLSWWKNNSFTGNAQMADKYLEELKKFESEAE